MRILAADEISNGSIKFELDMFAGRADVDFLDTGFRQMKQTGLPLTSWPEVVRRIRRGEYRAAFIGRPTRLWNPRKAAWRNAFRLAGMVRHGLRPFRLRALLSLLERARVPVAGVDMVDTPIIDQSRFPILAAARVFFKRELPTNLTNSFLYNTDRLEKSVAIMKLPFFQQGVAKLRPVSLGVMDARFERLAAYAPRKDIDLFFAGSLECRPVRAIGYRAIQRLKEEGFRVVATQEKFLEEEYLASAARALLCWSPEGFGFDCYRTYEAGALGTAPLLKCSPIVPHAGFSAGVDSVFYIHESIDLYDMIRAWLAQPAELEEMGRRAREHVRTHHRKSVLANYLLDTLLGSVKA